MASSDDRESLLRPRIGGRRGRVPQQRVPTFTSSVLARAQLRFARLARSGTALRPRHEGPGAPADVRRPSPDARRCVVKARVVQQRAGGIDAARLHLDYIERDGVEKDGSPGRVYSATETFDRDALARALPGERHQFRFIVSPEEAGQLDLTAFTRDLMAQMERDLGRALIWGAVNHHDTDNPHVHIVVRGVDRAGKAFCIAPAYISERLRWQAQHLVTRELGPRTGLDVDRQAQREISQERLTNLDRQLANLVAPDGSLDLRGLPATVDSTTRRRLTARLQVLEGLALAERRGAQTWHLPTGWQDVLRSLGERGDIIKRIHHALRGQGDPSRYAVVDGKTEQPTIEGVVRRKGLHDELTGEMYAVVETTQGRAHYVRVDATTADAVREGAIVRIAVSRERWAKPTDRVIAQVAAEAGGIYDPKAHLAELSARPIQIAGKPVDAAAVVEVNLRRLQRLERHQAVVALPDGTWQVPPDLVQRLVEREQSHPRFRTQVEVLATDLRQAVQLAAPTWLDGVDREPAARARYGFGAEVTVALRQREAILEGLGVRGTPAERQVALRAIERRNLAAAITAKTKGIFVENPPASFRGRVLPCDGTPSAAAYVRIVDEASGRFVLLPAAGIHRSLMGKMVQARTDAQGRSVVRAIGLARGE